MNKDFPIHSIASALRTGDPARAESLCLEALIQAPDNTDVLFSLAMSLHLQHKLHEAIPVYRRLTELQPESAVHWSNYASALTDAGELDEAERAFRRAIVLDMKNVDTRVQLSRLLVTRRDYLTARSILLDAFELDPHSPLVRIHAAGACTLCQDYQGADDLLQGWRRWLPLHDDGLQSELAHLLLLKGDASGARLVLEELVQRRPQLHGAKILLAKVLERVNRIGDAASLLRTLDHVELNEILRRDLMHAQATLALRSGEAHRALELLTRAGPVRESDFAYFYELARACDKLDMHDAAMQALQEAHARQTADLKITSPGHFTPESRPLPAATVTVSIEQYGLWPQYRAPEARDSPIFVVGFPRSGTTLLEQMLDAHPRLQSMDENPFFDRLANKLRSHDPRILDDLSVLRQYDCDELRKRYRIMASDKVALRPDAQLVDKNPLNMLWLPLIHRLFPKAKYILCLRHPCDVILSCYMQNFRSGILGAACENLPRLAAAYVQAMQTWLHHVEVFQPDVLISRYEDLVADLKPQTRFIADFLGLEDATPMLGFHERAREKDYIATPSYTQVIEPVSTKAVGRWQRYRQWFEPVLPTLKPMLEVWGYAFD
jgi:Flp pilus assembly protein TadD